MHWQMGGGDSWSTRLWRPPPSPETPPAQSTYLLPSPSSLWSGPDLHMQVRRAWEEGKSGAEQAGLSEEEQEERRSQWWWAYYSALVAEPSKGGPRFTKGDLGEIMAKAPVQLR